MSHRTIKRMIAGIVLAIIATTLTFQAHTTGRRDTVECHRASVYAITAKVIAVDAQSDTVTVQDSTGNLWAFGGVDDWEVNDCASLAMNNAGTQSIYDDEVVNARFNSWALVQ